MIFFGRICNETCNSSVFIIPAMFIFYIIFINLSCHFYSGLSDYSVGLEAAYKLLERENLDKQVVNVMRIVLVNKHM